MTAPGPRNGDSSGKEQISAGDEAQRMAGERRQTVGNPVADAGGHDDANQRRDEGHKRQNGFSTVSMVSRPARNSTATTGHSHTNFGQQAVALLGDLLLVS